MLKCYLKNIVTFTPERVTPTVRVKPHWKCSNVKIARGGERYRSDFFFGESMGLDLFPKKSWNVALTPKKNFKLRGIAIFFEKSHFTL